MEFSNFYSDGQQEMVLDIITDLKSKGVDVETSLDLRTGDRMGSLVLRGRADFNPEKELRRLYKEILGKDKASDVKSGDMVFSKTYDDNDKVMCSKIRLRLHNPEICQQHITNASIAASMGKTAGAISQIINGKYGASPTKHLHNIWGLIAPVELAKVVHANDGKKSDIIRIRYGDIPFVKTSLSNLMAIACNHARERRRFSVFAGTAGLGKSKSLAEYCRVHTDTILITGSEQTAGIQLVRELCSKLGLSSTSRQGLSALIDRIIYVLEDTDRLIILDEADKCKPNALDPLRTISDRARIGITLVGNNQLVDKLRSQERFELIASRVCFWPRPMGKLTIDDIQTLFLSISQNTLLLADNTENWWIWLHTRVEGNARELVENLLPHLLRFKDRKIDKLFVNEIFSTVLNKSAV